MSADVQRAAIVQDVTSIRRAATATKADQAVEAMYALLTDASKRKDANDGASRIRAGLPAIVGRFEQTYRSSRAEIETVKLRTKGGEAMRQIAVSVIDRWHLELLGSQRMLRRAV